MHNLGVVGWLGYRGRSLLFDPLVLHCLGSSEPGEGAKYFGWVGKAKQCVVK